MCNYAGVFKVMNAVVYYSNTGQSQSIAEFLANQLGFPNMDIEAVASEKFDNLVLVFPVHCQNLPDLIKAFIQGISVNNLTIVATYGKMCPGNVLYEIQKKFQKNIVAAAYVPTKHSYIEGDDAFNDFDKLQSLVAKIQNPSYIQLPKRYKNPLANVFPKLRSRLGLKIYKSDECNSCNLCGKSCYIGAIEKGTTNAKCIRCLKCVDKCPRKALAIRKGFWLNLYLRKNYMNELIIYV